MDKTPDPGQGAGRDLACIHSMATTVINGRCAECGGLRKWEDPAQVQPTAPVPHYACPKCGHEGNRGPGHWKPGSNEVCGYRALRVYGDQSVPGPRFPYRTHAEAVVAGNGSGHGDVEKLRHALEQVVKFYEIPDLSEVAPDFGSDLKTRFGIAAHIAKLALEPGHDAEAGHTHTAECYGNYNDPATLTCGHPYEPPADDIDPRTTV